MASLKDLIGYIVWHSSRKPLPVDFLMKLVYLADWWSVSTYGRLLTNCNWEFGQTGPESKEILEAAREPDSRFYVVLVAGSSSELPYAFQKKPLPPFMVHFELDQPAKDMLNKVIDTSESLQWPDFLRLLLSTYPLMMQPQFSILNLTELAEQEKSKRLLTHT